MPVLEIDLPDEIYKQIQNFAGTHERAVGMELLHLLEQGLQVEARMQTQSALLEKMRLTSFLPPPGSPDSVELLREDRGR